MKELMMDDAPAFFVPGIKLEHQESAYAEFARECHGGVPQPESRIYSITYVHDSEEWTATVGETLRGVRRKSSRSKGKTIERKIPLSDPAIVLAIFPGEPFMVVTNHGILENVGSRWENPFMAGRPRSVSYFSVAESA